MVTLLVGPGCITDGHRLLFPEKKDFAGRE
jgi:hypothetical protein